MTYCVHQFYKYIYIRIVVCVCIFSWYIGILESHASVKLLLYEMYSVYAHVTILKYLLTYTNEQNVNTKSKSQVLKT